MRLERTTLVRTSRTLSGEPSKVGGMTVPLRKPSSVTSYH